MGGIILVVENHDDLRDLMVTELSHVGFETLGARSARQALSFLEDVAPCAIVIDFLLADMNGVELAKVIRARPSFKVTPLLMLTGAPDVARRELSRAGMAVQVLEKPVDPETLTRKIDDLCRIDGVILHDSNRYIMNETPKVRVG
jgi:DNA-binding response OmpR family regulator